MYYVAFTLGLFGSIHCLGMCGPLAITFCNKPDNSNWRNIFSALSYNLGRTCTYAILGLVFGLVGSLFFIVDLQKILSVLLGIALILSFVFSVRPERTLQRNRVFQKILNYIRQFISSMLQKSQAYHPFQLGMANGLLPCGLVYLALAGALATGNIYDSILFMTLFGLGTLPMLFALTTGIGFFPRNFYLKLSRFIPYLSLCFGMFLIYRGLVVDMPAELNFWEAMLNPIMCH